MQYIHHISLFTKKNMLRQLTRPGRLGIVQFLAVLVLKGLKTELFCLLTGTFHFPVFRFFIIYIKHFN